jgi:hypothetical protein
MWRPCRGQRTHLHAQTILFIHRSNWHKAVAAAASVVVAVAALAVGLADRLHLVAALAAAAVALGKEF